jgi:hypothetical protein
MAYLMPEREPAEESEPTEVGRPAILAAFGAAILLLHVFVVSGWPLGGDQQVFAWLADTALRGGVPYRDAFDTKGPMAWLPIALVRAIAPVGHVVAIRLVELLSLAAGMVAVHGLARRCGGGGVALLAPLLLYLWCIGLGFWDSHQPDGWAGAWLAVAMACAIAPGRTLAVLAGTLVICAAAVKPTYAAFLLPVCLLARHRRTSAPAIALPTAGALLGGLLIGGTLASMGALTALVEAWRWTATTYVGERPGVLTLLATLLDVIGARPLGLALPFAALGIVHRWQRGERWVATGLAVWLLGALATVSLQARFWPYHWLPVHFPLATCAAMGIAAIRVERGGATIARGAIAAVLLLLSAMPIARLTLHRIASLRSADAFVSYQRRAFDSYGTQPGSVLAIADSLTRGTPSEDGLLVWGFYAGVPTLVGQRAATRYGIIIPLFVGERTGVRSRVRSEFLQELAARPPRWWLFPSSAMRDRSQETAAWSIDRFPEARAFRDSAYLPPRAAGAWLVYQRRH